jgi:hypothetical protein
LGLLPAARYYGTPRYVVVRQKMSGQLSPAVLPTGAQKVLDHILTEPLGYRPKQPAAIAPGHILDESRQSFVFGEHENVQGRTAPSHLIHFGEGEFQGLR